MPRPHYFHYFPHLSARRKAIAHTLDGDDIARISRIIAQFLPQLTNQHAQIVRFILLRWPPYFPAGCVDG